MMTAPVMALAQVLASAQVWGLLLGLAP